MSDSLASPIHVFIDTEFTRLNLLEKKLISVGFYAEYETEESKYGRSETFYMELTDTYTKNDCSDFVVKTVLPLLKNIPEYTGTRNRMIVDMFSRIEDMPRDVVLVSDAPSWDFSFFTTEFNDPSIRPKNLVALASLGAGPELPPELIVESGLEHNALYDAWANYCYALHNRRVTGDNGIKIVHTFSDQTKANF